MRSRSSDTATQTFQCENSVDSRPGYTINACLTASPVHPRTQFPSPRLRVGYRNRKLGYSRDLEGKVPCEGVPRGSQRTQWDGAWERPSSQRALRMQPNAAGLPSVGNRKSPNSFNGKGRTKVAHASVRREPAAHPHAATRAWRHNKLFAP